MSRTKNKIFIDLSQRDTKRWAGRGDALKYSGSREGRGIQYCVGGNPGWGEIPAAPAGTAPHTLGSGLLRRGVCGGAEAGHRLP